MRVSRYSEGSPHYSEREACAKHPEGAEALLSPQMGEAIAPRNNVDYPEGMRWIVRVKVGLCVVYGLLILGASLALTLPQVPEPDKGQMGGLVLSLLMFGVLEGLEAWGLKRRALWGSYLTMGRTLLLLPAGLYLMLQQADPWQEGFLLLANALIVIYLVRDLPRLRRF